MLSGTLAAGSAAVLPMQIGDDEQIPGIINVLGHDDIPAIDDPQWDGGGRLSDADEVIVHELANGTAQVYPLRILDWHEIANDVVDGRPLSIIWCPLCGTSVSWNRTVNGSVTTLGVSGELYKHTMVMYDRASGTLWSQRTGEGLHEEHEGEYLDFEGNTLTTAG